MIFITGQSDAARDHRQGNDRENEKWLHNTDTFNTYAAMKIDLGGKDLSEQSSILSNESRTARNIALYMDNEACSDGNESLVYDEERRG